MFTYRRIVVAGLCSLTAMACFTLSCAAQGVGAKKPKQPPVIPNPLQPNPVFQPNPLLQPNPGINPGQPNPANPQGKNPTPNPKPGTTPGTGGIRINDYQARFDKAMADALKNQARIDAIVGNATKPPPGTPTMQSLQAQVMMMQYPQMMMPFQQPMMPYQQPTMPWQQPYQMPNNPWGQQFPNMNNPWGQQMVNPYAPRMGQPGMIGPWQQQLPFGFPGNQNNPAGLGPAVPGMFGPAPFQGF